MAKLSLTSNGNGGSKEYSTLPTDIYVMAIAKAEMEPDQYGKKDKDGNLLEEKLVIRWEVCEDTRTEGQIEEGVMGGEAVWQRLNPWYGMTKNGAPSKFKEFVDSLQNQGLLDLDLGEIDTDLLIGIRQKVMVEEKPKTMGPNAGAMGNYVRAVKPMKAPKNRPVPIQDDDISTPADPACGPVEVMEATITEMKRVQTAQGTMYRITLDGGNELYTATTSLVTSLREVEFPYTCEVSYRINPAVGFELMGFSELTDAPLF